jgi:hypothetical protein
MLSWNDKSLLTVWQQYLAHWIHFQLRCLQLFHLHPVVKCLFSVTLKRTYYEPSDKRLPVVSPGLRIGLPIGGKDEFLRATRLKWNFYWRNYFTRNVTTTVTISTPAWAERTPRLASGNTTEPSLVHESKNMYPSLSVVGSKSLQYRGFLYF